MEVTDWEVVDVVILVLYFVFVLAIGLWTLCRPNRGSVTSYFLAGRDMGWWPVGASLYASNIGSEHFIGLAGTGAASGIAVVLYEWMSMPLVILLSWLFLPVYLSSGVFTLPEYLEKRFGGERLRIYISCLALLLYIVTKIAVSIYAGALFIQMSLGWDMYLSIIVLLAITGIYTVLGGLAAVIYTDALQTVIMTIGAIALTIISFYTVNGYENLKYQYMRAVPSVRGNNTQCGFPRSDAFHIFRDPVNADFPWPGLVLQATLGCVWYWCADQVIVQRALAAKNLSQAKGGSVLAGYLKLLPLYLMVFPGMISRTLYPDEVGCIDPEECKRICNNEVGCSNIAYPLLVMTLLPAGLKGLLVAVMMSAIMSSLTSIFNSASTLFTIDLWHRIRPKAGQRELLITGRLVVLILCGISILWLPLLQSSAGGQLFVYIQSIQGYLGTPIGALFLLAIFCKRVNEKGAFFGILFGHLCGIVRMILDFVYPAPQCGQPDDRPLMISELHYTYFSQLNFLATALVILGISLITKKQNKDELTGVTWWTRRDQKIERKTSLDNGKEQKTIDPAGCQPLQLEPETSHPRTSDTTSSISSRHQQQSASVARRWFNIVCGLPENQTETMSLSEEAATAEESYAERMKLLKERPFVRRILNANAVIGISITIFLCGLYY